MSNTPFTYVMYPPFFAFLVVHSTPGWTVDSPEATPDLGLP